MGLSGRFRSALIIGGQGIRARKLRTFLSMISLFLGVLGVVAAQAGQVIAQRALVASTELTQGVDGTQQIYLPGSGKDAEIAMESVAGRTDAVALISTSVIIGEPNVRPINEGGAPLDGSGGGYGGMMMQCDSAGNCYEEDPNAGKPSGQAIELRTLALTGDVRQFRPLRVQNGQWLDFGGAPSMAPRLVLNKAAAKGFAMYQVPAEMRMQGATANSTPRIIGVVDDGSGQPQAYVRADELLNWMPVDALSNPNFGTPELLAAPTATDFVEILRKKVAAASDDPRNAEVYVHTISAEEMMPGEIALMRWVFLGVSILVLLIGSAGILNVGLATVGERIEEFALRRAVGTPRLLLAGIVLAETLLTGLLTAAAAIGAGILGLAAASKLYGDTEPMLADVTFPWQAGVAGVAAGLIAGMLGGLVPAARAARIPIATVMRA